MSQFQTGDLVRFTELALKLSTTLPRGETGEVTEGKTAVELVTVEFAGRPPLAYPARFLEKVVDPSGDRQ